MGSTIIIIRFAIWTDLTSAQLLNHTIKTPPTVYMHAYGQPQMCAGYVLYKLSLEVHAVPPSGKTYFLELLQPA